MRTEPDFPSNVSSEANSDFYQKASTYTSSTPYTPRFYERVRSGCKRSAEIVVPILLDLVNPDAVIDVGCGDGTWLSVFRELGVTCTLGLDGEYVDRRLLQISQDQFSAADLSLPFRVGRTFDLAISLEVAEHLPPASADGFVLSLTKLAPVVLFSSAIPLQGGAQHLNEQWPDYWASLFRGYGYLPLDCIRPKIWNNENVDWWYIQNSFIYASQDFIESHDVLRRAYEQTNHRQIRLVHPRKYIEVARADFSVWKAWNILARSLKSAVHRRI
jgi:SAM-dependent methyltransferase